MYKFKVYTGKFRLIQGILINKAILFKQETLKIKQKWDISFMDESTGNIKG